MRIFLHKFVFCNAAFLYYFLGIVGGVCNPLRGELWIFGGHEHDFGQIKLQDLVEIFRSKDSTQDIRLKSRSYHPNNNNLVYLDFEQATAAELKEQSGHLNVQKSLYFVSKDAHNGRQAALFNGPEHGVQLESSNEFGNKQESSQDFTIEMWIKALFLGHNTILLEKTSFLDNRKSSLKIGIQKHRLFVDLQNLFHDIHGKSYSIRLDALERIKIGKWQHLSFTYQAAQGRLALYLNGREQEVLYARNREQSWQMRFPALDHSPLILAKAFIGLIDEFRIARGAFSPQKQELHISKYEPLKINFETQEQSQKSAQVISSLLRFPQKKIARFAQISYKAIEPQGTALNLYVRHSQKPFASEAASPAWHRIRKSELSLPAFRYFQWRATLLSDPLGASTPVLKSIRVDYRPVLPPPIPQSLRIVRPLTKDLQICLEWQRSPRQEDPKSGYYVYYGLVPGKYMGRLEFYQTGREIKNLREITKESHSMILSPSERQLQETQPELSKSILYNRTRILISNRSIERDLSVNFKKRLPLLRYDRNYYFAVSAYDEFSESPLSNEVHAYIRP